MRKSFFATIIGAITISIAGMAAPVLAHDVSAPQPQVYQLQSRVAPGQALQISLLTPAKVQHSVQPVMQYWQHKQQELNSRITHTVKKSGHEVRELSRLIEKDWYHHQLRQRHPHSAQS